MKSFAVHKSNVTHQQRNNYETIKIQSTIKQWKIIALVEDLIFITLKNENQKEK